MDTNIDRRGFFRVLGLGTAAALTGMHHRPDGQFG